MDADIKQRKCPMGECMEIHDCPGGVCGVECPTHFCQACEV